MLRPALLAFLWLACAAQSQSEEPVLRVGTSGDYAPFSVRDGSVRSGFDVEVARAYARERGLRIRWVPVHWATLDRDLGAGRFDVVMSGVTVRPERSVAGRFTLPVASAGAIALVRDAGRVREAGDLDQPGVRIAVNAGGHLERVARRLFPAARLAPRTQNRAVREALLQGDADAALTDTLEAPHWLEGTSGLRALGPFTRDRKAYWLPPDAGERARDLDAWLLAREADGTLAALRARHLPPSAERPSATPLAALAAAVEERLSLMPLVAEAKRAAGAPVRDPAQEAAVLRAAVHATRDAARRAGLPTPDEAATRGFFGALIDAARAVQEHALAGGPVDSKPPDLEAALRPALARIGERIAELAVRLPDDLDTAAARAALSRVEAAGLTDVSRDRIASALVAMARSTRSTRRSNPRRAAARFRSRSSRGRARCRRLAALRDAPQPRA